MNRINLYRGNDDESQTLRLSFYLRNLHRHEDFADAVGLPFGATITESEGQTNVNNLELVVRPPIPKERIAEFGNTIVSFAYANSATPQDEVTFVNHTMNDEELLKDAIARKVGKPVDKDPTLKEFFAQFGSREALEESLYGRILSADEVQQRIDHLRRELETEYHLSPAEIEVMLASDYELMATKRGQEAEADN